MEANEYLQQVVQDQARVQGELRMRSKRKTPAPAGKPEALGVAEAAAFQNGSRDFDADDATAEAAPGQAVEYRITGFWRWKTVVVPPNVYVVHTRRGHAEVRFVGIDTVNCDVRPTGAHAIDRDLTKFPVRE